MTRGPSGGGRGPNSFWTWPWGPWLVRSLWMAGRACQGPSLPSRRPGFTVHGGPPRSPEHRGRRRRLFPLPVPSRPVPSLPRARRSPAPPACLSLRSKKKNKKRKNPVRGASRSIDRSISTAGVVALEGGAAEERAAMAWSKLNPCALVSHVLFKVRLPLPHPLGRPRPPLPLCQATRLDPRALITLFIR